MSLTLLDLARVPEVVNLTEMLARKLAIAMANDSDEMERATDAFVHSQTIEEKPFVDVADLCLNLLRDCRDPSLRGAAEALGDFFDQVRTRPSSAPARPAPDASFWNTAGTPVGPQNCKVSVCTAPHVEPSIDPDVADKFYNELTFAKETLWGKVRSRDG